jgi:alpha-L-fucosidase
VTAIKFPRNRTEWFDNARFGMFIHWGLYSLVGRGEWVMNREQIPAAQYRKLLKRFDARDYDPAAWAALARDAGMKYMVLTTKHHEGFCLWNSKACAYNATASEARRDLLAEYVTAVRNAGLKVGLYYSLGDWHHPDWVRGFSGDAGSARARERFMDYTHELVRELMTGYGKIDILWYDLPQNYSAAQWRSVELNAMARSLQPHIIINNRAMTTEDLGTPERHITASGGGRMWESCITLNDSWGYTAADTDWKSAREVVLMLADVASGGGNLLLNVGPDGHGRIPQASVDILRQVGRWVRRNGESIYGSQRHRMSWNLWGASTAVGNNLYVHLKRYFAPTLTIGGLLPKARSAEVLGTGQKLSLKRVGRQTIIGGLPVAQPDELAPVVKVELDAPPAQDFLIGVADVWPDFPK